MQSLKDLSTLNDKQLVSNFSWVVQREREALAQVIAHIAEIRRRELYVKAGYSSLFNYLIQEFHYSESAAYRRIQAAKMCLLFPEVLELLEQGKVNLLTLSLIEPHVTAEDGKLIYEIIGKSKREVEYLLSSLFPKREVLKDSIRRLPVVSGVAQESLSEPHAVTSETEPLLDLQMAQKITTTGGSGSGTTEVREVRRIKIEFCADALLAEKIERAKEVLRHKYPQAKLEEIFDEALEALLEKKDPERKVVRMEKRKEEKQELVSDEKSCEKMPIKTRYIPERIRLQVWKRDAGQCTYRSPEGRRCAERNWIEVDHAVPWSLGGSSSAENLRLLCRQHNLWRNRMMRHG